MDPADVSRFELFGFKMLRDSNCLSRRRFKSRIVAGLIANFTNASSLGISIALMFRESNCLNSDASSLELFVSVTPRAEAPVCA
jgi:hypothetical protein